MWETVVTEARPLFSLDLLLLRQTLSAATFHKDQNTLKQKQPQLEAEANASFVNVALNCNATAAQCPQK